MTYVYSAEPPELSLVTAVTWFAYALANPLAYTSINNMKYENPAPAPAGRRGRGRLYWERSVFLITWW